MTEFLIVLLLVAYVACYFLRFRIDDWCHQQHLHRLVNRLSAEYSAAELKAHLIGGYDCFWASSDENGWHVTVRLPEYLCNDWPPFVHRIDTLMRDRLQKETHSGNGFNKESYYSYAGTRSGDIAWVATQLLNLHQIPHRV